MTSTRYLVLAVTVLILLSSFADVISFNMAVICMTKKVFNGTAEAEIEIFSVEEKGLLYSIIAIGCLISSLTVMKVIDLCGGRLTVIMYTSVAGIATICLPMCAQIGFIPVLLARLFQGIGAGIGFAFIGYMASAWSPIESYGIFMCALTSYGQLGPLIMMTTVGYSCGTKFGWEGVYYVSGAVTLIICVLFYYIYTDTPRQHKYVSSKELILIENCKSIFDKSEKQKIPYFEMIKDKSVIGTMIMTFGDFISYNIFLFFAPVYLNKVLKLNVEETGISSALPYIGSLCLKLFIGPWADRITFVSVITNIRIFQFSAQIVMTFCLIFLAIIPIHWIFVPQLIYFVAVSCSSFACVGYYKAASISYGHLLSTVMSWQAIIYSIVILILPLLKTYIVPDDSPEQWRIFFYLGASISLITVLIWFYCVDVKLRPWADVDNDKKSSKLNVTELAY